MAHNAYIKGATVGAWATGTTPSQADWARVDVAQFQSINGDLGGAWSPSNAIAIGGAGLYMAGPFHVGAVTSTFDGATHFNGTNQFSGTTTFDGITEFNDTVNITADVYITTGGLSVGYGASISSTGYSVSFPGTGNFTSYKSNFFIADVHCNDTLAVAGAATFDDAVTLGNNSADAIRIRGTTTVEAPLAFNSPPTFATGSNLNGVMTPGTNGYIVKRTTNVSSGGGSASLADYDHARVTATGTFTLADVGNDGAVFRVVNNSGGTVNVRTPGGVLLKPLGVDTWCDFMRDATATYGWFNAGEGTCTAIS